MVVPSTTTFWPSGIPMVATEETFVQLLGLRGYSPCASPAHETGYEKIALFVSDSQVTHAARQLPSGRWTSKCGQNVDIEHDLHDLEGPRYGKVKLLLARRLPCPVVSGQPCEPANRTPPLCRPSTKTPAARLGQSQSRQLLSLSPREKQKTPRYVGYSAQSPRLSGKGFEHERESTILANSDGSGRP